MICRKSVVNTVITANYNIKRGVLFLTRNEGVVGSNPIFSFIKKVKLTTVIIRSFGGFFILLGCVHTGLRRVCINQIMN